MAYGNEVVLGWGLSDYAAVAGALGLKLPCSADPDEWIPDEEFGDIVKIPKGYFDRLRTAHIAALADAGFAVVDVAHSSMGYVVADTPCGRREFQPFVFTLFYDVSEMGDTPETSTFGVGLSARYRPTFLDWKGKSGTLYPVRFDPEMLRMIQIARQHIEKAFPIFATAMITVVERHY